MKVIIICGATATGKTALAIDLALQLQCEIINFDSICFYSGLDIGSAKPTKKELAKVKHHLINFITPDQSFSAGDFRRQALTILKQQFVQHKFCILVGGTGFYLNALLKGMFEVEKADLKLKQHIQDEYHHKGIKPLYDELQKFDSENKIHINDTYRVLRAIEIIRATNKKPSSLKSVSDFPYEYIKIGLRREKSKLKNIIQSRSLQMLENGMQQEVEGLVLKYGAQVRALQSVGYKQVLQYLLTKSNATQQDLAEEITQATMQLVKKQSTWFKRDEEIHWFDPDKENVLEKVLGLHIIQKWR